MKKWEIKYGFLNTFISNLKFKGFFRECKGCGRLRDFSKKQHSCQTAHIFELCVGWFKGKEVKGRMSKTHPRLPWVPGALSPLASGGSCSPCPEPGPGSPTTRCCRVILSLNIWHAWSRASLFTLQTLGFSSPHPPNSTGSFPQQEHPDSPQGHLAPLPNALRGICAGRGRPCESQSHLVAHAHCKDRLALSWVLCGLWHHPDLGPTLESLMEGGGWRWGQGGDRAKWERVRNVAEIR